MSDETNRVEHSKEFSELYRTFSAVQAAAIEYVRQGKDDADKKNRAKKAAIALRDGTIVLHGERGEVKLQMLLSGDQCWDPITEQYVSCPDNGNM